MITPKEAVDRAMQAAKDLLEGEELSALRLEEIKLNEDGQYWNITLGWVEPAARTLMSALPFGAKGSEILKLPRVYKVFQINATSGAVHSMIIRDVD